jgi:hypothetical protein
MSDETVTVVLDPDVAVVFTTAASPTAGGSRLGGE